MKSSSHGQIQENRRETMMMNTGLVRLFLEVVAASCLLVSVSKGCYFYKIPFKAIQGHNNRIEYGITEDECIWHCLVATDFSCQSMDYKANPGSCYLSNETRATVGDAYNNDTDEAYYEKMGCEGNANSMMREELYNNAGSFKISGAISLLNTTTSTPESCPLLCVSMGDVCFTVVAHYVNLTCELYSGIPDSYTLVADSDARLMWRHIDMVVEAP